MDATASPICPNPAGELKNAPEYPVGSWPLDTPGGRFYAEWDDQAPVTREGQLIFFFQFLQAGGRWEEFLRACPLHYTGNRGSGATNVMGTVLLSVLCGHWRYRIGQTKDVQVYLPMLEHPTRDITTFDTGLDRLISQKKRLAGSLGLIPVQPVSMDELVDSVIKGAASETPNPPVYLNAESACKLSWELFEALIAEIFDREPSSHWSVGR